MTTITTAEANYLHILLTMLKIGEEKFTLTQLLDSPFYSSILDKCKNEMDDFISRLD